MPKRGFRKRKERSRKRGKRIDTDNGIIVEKLDDSSKYPFNVKRITSPELIHLFSSTYNFHTIDTSGEPVLNILVDDPIKNFPATASMAIKLFYDSLFPVILIEMTLYDIPDNPLKVNFIYKIDIERHRRELEYYKEMKYITVSFFFRDNGELFYGFSKAVELSETLRNSINDIILSANSYLDTIPEETRDFAIAVKKLLGNKESPNHADVIDNVTKYTIQINGKKRSYIFVQSGTDRTEIEKMALTSSNVAKYIKGETRKVIIIPNRSIDIITE